MSCLTIRIVSENTTQIIKWHSKFKCIYSWKKCFAPVWAWTEVLYRQRSQIWAEWSPIASYTSLDLLTETSTGLQYIEKKYKTLNVGVSAGLGIFWLQTWVLGLKLNIWAQCFIFLSKHCFAPPDQSIWVANHDKKILNFSHTRGLFIKVRLL